jgi:hypothetical protein
MERGTTPYSDTNNFLIVGSTGLGVLILVVILIWLRSWFFAGRNEAVQKLVLSVENPVLLELVEHEEIRLTTYGWVDKEKGVVRIPIDRAMTLLVEEVGETPAPETGDQ